MGKIAIIHMYRGGEIRDDYYHVQEVGLAKAIRKRKPDTEIEVWMLAHPNAEFSERKISDGITMLVIPSDGLGHQGKLNNELLVKRGISRAQINADNNLFVPNTLQYCNQHGIKAHLYIGTIQSDKKGLVANWRSRLIAGRLARKYRNAKVYAKTPTVLNQCRELGMQNVQLFPVGLDLERLPVIHEEKAELRNEFQMNTNQKWLLFVGRLEAYKQPQHALELLRELSDEYHLIMIGKGSMADWLIRYAEDNALADRLVMLEQVPNVDVLRYAKACDYYVNFNEQEIYGMAILEAMSAGCVPVALRAPGPEFIIENGTNGLLCGSIEEMKNVIQSTDDSLHSQMSDEAEKRIRDCFSWEYMLDAYASNAFELYD